MEPLGHYSEQNNKLILDRYKKNNDTFRNTMERIFHKYSSLRNPGPDVCLKTMTFTSDKGSVPLNSNTAKKELQNLENQLEDHSLEAKVWENPQDEHTLLDQDASISLSSCQMDVSVVGRDRSSQMENSNNSLWCGSETSKLSLKSVSSSHSCLWAESSQPEEEEEDQDLERTLSNNRTLLDVYPSMLNQIGEAYRRQHVNDVANAVLRRYHRRRWRSSQALQRNHGFSKSFNHTLNRRQSEPKPPQNINNQQKSPLKYRKCSPPTSKRYSSSVKSVSNTSFISNTFYSPRRDDLEKKTEEDDRSCWTDQQMNNKSPRQPVRVLDLSTPPSSALSSPRSQSPDLNQTYIVEPVPFPRPHPSFPTSSVYSTTLSPLKMARLASLASRGGITVNCSPSYSRPGLHRDHGHSPSKSPHRGHHPQLRSPLKPRIITLDHDQQTYLPYPKQILPVIHTSEVCRVSPLKSPRYPSPCKQSPVQPENPSKQLKRHSFFSDYYSPSPSVSQTHRQQIDAQFTRIYHHFICRSTNPTSSCSLCKRQSLVRSPAVSSTSISALFQTPGRIRLTKRHREPEVVESLRFKRFRESCSPRRTTPFWPNQEHQQQANRSMNTSIVEPNEDKYTWKRSLLLQCPSPGFLRGIRQQHKSTSGNNGKGPSSRPDLHMQHYSPSRRDLWRSSGAGAENFGISDTYTGTRSPIGTWDASGVSASPRWSRKRLVYEPLQ